MITSPAATELAQLIRSVLRDGMTAEEAATSVLNLFEAARDEWEKYDVSTYAQPGQIFHQRYLVVTVPREQHQVTEPTPNREHNL